MISLRRADIFRNRSGLNGCVQLEQMVLTKSKKYFKFLKLLVLIDCKFRKEEF